MRLTSSVMPGAGRVSKAEAPPDIRQMTRSSGPADRASSRMRPSRLFARGVGHGMGGFHHFDMTRRCAVAVARHHEALAGVVPGVLEGTRHARRRLAGADHDRAALGRRRQTIRELPFRARGGEGCLEQGEEDGLVGRAFACRIPQRGLGAVRRNSLSPRVRERGSRSGPRLGCAKLRNDGNGKGRDGRAGLVLELVRENSTLDEMGILDRLAQILEKRAAAIRLLENHAPMKRANAPRQALARAPACLRGSRASVRHSASRPIASQKPLPEFLLERADREHLAVRGRIELVARASPREPPLAAAEPAARGEALGERERHEGECVLRHGDIEMATGAARLAGTQGKKDVHHGGVAATTDVGDKGRRHDRFLLRAKGKREQARVADIVDVVAGAIALATALAIAGEGAIDEPRVERGRAS